MWSPDAATTALTGTLQTATPAALPTAGEAGQDQIRNWSCARLAVVTTPAEAGRENAHEFWVALADACAGHAVTIADMTGTVVCGHDAVTVLLMALRCTDTIGGLATARRARQARSWSILSRKSVVAMVALRGWPRRNASANFFACWYSTLPGSGGSSGLTLTSTTAGPS